MIKRVVKLKIHPDKIEETKNFIFKNLDAIRKSSGCHHVEILQDIKNNTNFFTYSTWDDEESLNNYRHSEFFREFWPGLKKFFSTPAEAWTTEVVSCDPTNFTESSRH